MAVSQKKNLIFKIVGMLTFELYGKTLAGIS